MNSYALRVPVFTAVLLAAIMCTTGCCTAKNGIGSGLVGAWRGKVQFTTGAFATTKDLEFMYVFNAGGTMTESSNYDASPPVAPAYGVWRKVGAREYEAKYEYYWTKAPANFDEISKGGGWSPGGHGVLTQRIALSEDGSSFDSMIKYEVFDQQGKPTEGASEAVGKGIRIRF
jgi:hypothetical protein